MNCLFQSTKVIELGSCAFRQPNAALNRSGAGENSARCSFVHGYKLTAKFWFGCNSLDNKNWVVDFGGLKELKNTLQKQFDHTLCIDIQDPLLPLFKQLHEAGGCDLRIMEYGVGIERTAEFCGKVADTLIRKQTDNRCWVEKVEVFEHELNSAIYIPKYEVAASDTQSVVTSQSPQGVQQPVAPTVNRNSVPAPIGNVVTGGKGDWFAGTTWGSGI
jgi:6-pyruvoyltetrahydropterin/6-carboxytetrahydropterin synthase